MKHRRNVLVLVAVIAVVVAGVVIYLNRIGRSVQDAYAGLQASVLIIDFLESHQGQWPRSWSDLDADPADIEYLRGRVSINWAIETDEFLAALRDGETPIVVQPVDPDAFFWGDPNARILNHFRFAMTETEQVVPETEAPGVP